MFEVRLKYQFDERFSERDDQIIAIAGLESHFSGTDGCTRDHGWRVATFDDATELKAKLGELDWANVTIQEV